MNRLTFTEQIVWSRNLFAMIALGGTWGVPRSGLIFTKRSETELELTGLMPYTAEMSQGFAYGFDVPPTPGTLLDYQRSDFDCLTKRFGPAGITLTDPNNLLQRKEGGT